MLFCYHHWCMVPARLQQAVWATYRPGQCDDKAPSEEWHRAADAAICYVAAKEGRSVTQAQSQALLLLTAEFARKSASQT